jgi:hypothetical protein
MSTLARLSSINPKELLNSSPSAINLVTAFKELLNWKKISRKLCNYIE